MLTNSFLHVGGFLQLYTFNVIGAITTGQPLRLMEREGEDGTIANIHAATTYGSFVGLVPELYLWFRKYFEYMRPLGLKSSRVALLNFVNFPEGDSVE